MRRVSRRNHPALRPARRRGFALPQWVAPAAKVCAVAVLAALAVGGPWALWRAGIAQRTIERVETAFIEFTGMVGLVVDDVLVEGRVETKARDVLAALKVQRGMPVLAVDPRAAKERLEQIPWVREAAVERRLPGLVSVRLVERMPMALWQHEGRFVLIDRHGVQIETEEVGRFGSLPHIVGENAGEAAGELLRMLSAEPALERRVVAAIRVAGRRWNLRLDNGVDVMLPAENATAAWMQLAAYEREQGILARDVKAIDLRLPDRVVLKPNPSAVPPAPQPGRPAQKKA
jgi:cell division protein FtsQ